MTIALAGRKNSFKTELAKLGEPIGYKIKSIHDYFRGLADRFMRGEIIPYRATVEKSLIENKILQTVDDIAHFLRYKCYHEDKNVSHLKFFLSNEDKIIDDVKLPEEVEFFTRNKVIVFHVCRVHNFQFVNDEIESLLTSRLFSDSLFIRSKEGISSVEYKFKTFLHKFKVCKARVIVKGFEDKYEAREFLKETSNLTHEDAANMLGVTRNRLQSIYNVYLIDKRREKFSIDRHSFSKISVEAAYYAGLIASDGCIKNSDGKWNRTLALSVQLSDKELIEGLKKFMGSSAPDKIEKKKEERHKQLFCFSSQSPSIIENLKLWNIKPKKSTKEEIPFPTIKDETLFKAWIVGMIDGDGHVSISKAGQLNMGLLSSVNVIDCISKAIPKEINFSTPMVTTTNGLTMKRLIFHNHMAVDFFNWLGKPDYGLKRKWSNIQKFLNNPTKRRSKTSEYSE